MTRLRLSRVFAAACSGSAILAIALAAVPALADDDAADPGDPGVARVSLIAGAVDVKRGDSGDTVAAAINAPLSPGDYLSTRDDSHAEVEFDYGTDLRVGANTQLRFTQLDPKNHQLQLAAGTVDLRVFRGLDANAQIQTPQATIQPDESGSYIVSVDDDGNAQVSARSGRVDVISAAGTQTLVPGSTLAISGDVDHPQFRTIDAVAYQGFDGWIASRDAAVARVAAASEPYVDAGMVGADDLYDHGRWIDYPQYGRVWIPAVAPGWAPYHDGRWVWEPYYGWTWVDNEPWGWAPFHYGNWFYTAGYGWAWYPGTYAVARPYVYRPALVAFFSFGGGGGFSIGFGNVGWVPIAPYEPFHPWWGSGGGFGYGGTTVVNNTTIVNNYTNINITKVYNNTNAPGGVVGISNGNFANGNFHGVRTLQPIEIRGAEPIRGIVPIVPTQNNLAFRTHESGLHPIEPIARFGAFRTQAIVTTPSFAEQRARIQTVALRAYPHQAEAITRSAAPPSAFDEPSNGTRPAYARSNDAFSRFDRSQPQGATGESAPAYHAPTYHEPTYREPTYREPTYREPTYREPTYRQPTYRAPTYRAPTYHTSTYGSPGYHAQPYRASTYHPNHTTYGSPRPAPVHRSTEHHTSQE